MSCLPWLLPGWGPWLVLLLMWGCCVAEELKPTRWPLFSQKPVLLAWNAPTEDCWPRHSIRFKLDQFEIVASPNEGFVKQNLTIFYKDRLGLYPYFKKDGQPVNGGLPQVASLTEHQEKMPEGVNKYIREPKAKGLAVIDWEEWRPLWIRNWDTKDVYRNHSRLLVKQKNPTWPPEKVAKVAQQEYEMSAKRFMLETLRLAKSLRSEQLWGFYLFPDCYNHDYKNSLENYTGRCPDAEVARNDHLTWLWTESTALFPSIYMGNVLRSTTFGRQFVRNRVKEGMRLALVGDGLARPVFVYTRPTYANELTELTEASCSSLNEYLLGPLGRYLLNITTAAEHCSRLRCSSHGRCLRRHPDTDTYLHLSTSSHYIYREDGKLGVAGQPGTAERELYRSEFRCQCYSGYKGDACAQTDPSQQQHGASAGLQAWLSCLLLPLLLPALLH
ncbi:hypothetical protein JZ751_014553 [Albula glossodonta]|uniref:Hyaluronidase n=1 Tax=Albula glossodonta TaxID=121402 RepID=A0A8T2MWF6_9TELE|nr:hypothetical protein JZ751_014553 [Albula glossodonta]